MNKWVYMCAVKQVNMKKQVYMCLDKQVNMRSTNVQVLM